MKQAILRVIKIGGKVLDAPDALGCLLDELAEVPGPVIVVHGGGSRATELAGALGVSQTLVEGRRITDEATLDIALMAYAGELNKKLVAALQARSCNAIGLSGADGNMLRAVKRNPVPLDFGWVGDPDPRDLNINLLDLLLQQGLTPVFCALTHDGMGHMLNTNADTMAATIAAGLAERYEVNLLYLFEKAGVLREVSDEGSLIPEIRLADIPRLKEQGVLSEGMLPKMHNATVALEHGVKRVLIGSSGRLQEALKFQPESATHVIP